MGQITHDDVVKWVEKINKKFGRHCNDWTVHWAELLISRGATVELHDDWYIMCMLCPDAWGDMQLAVLSCACNGAAAFRKMQRRIEQLARENGAKYIEQGSELDDKYNEYLRRHGYRARCFRKEV